MIVKNYTEKGKLQEVLKIQTSIKYRDISDMYRVLLFYLKIIIKRYFLDTSIETY
jgi:hypothetical protein